MQRKHLPKKPGIYQILNTVSGKVYVGSAVDLRERARIHSYYLAKRRHHCPGLQAAWNRYGPDALQMHVLELVDDPTTLIGREQFWMDALDVYMTGYNCAPTAGSQAGWKMTPEQLAEHRRKRTKPTPGFITPDGAELTVLDGPLFREQTGMPQPVFSGLKRGVTVSWKGWTHVNAKKKQREYIKTYEGFVDPNGDRVGPITNLEKFSRERDLDPSGMRKVYRGKAPSYRGWTHVDSVNHKHAPKRVRTYHGFIDPDGKQRVITNLRGFCRENGLDHPTMYKVLQGKARQHKGWTYDPKLEK